MNQGEKMKQWETQDGSQNYTLCGHAGNENSEY